jgi:hypothetical protein
MVQTHRCAKKRIPKQWQVVCARLALGECLQDGDEDGARQLR